MNRAGSAPGFMSRLPHSARTSSTSSAVTHSVSTPSRTSSDNPIHGCIPGIMHDRCHLTERYFAADKQRHWPGTSKWNKVEHRLFSVITMNWRGRPLTSHAVVLQSIAAATTATGLTVTAALDEGRYPTGTKISGEQMTELEERALTRHRFSGAWNYTARPPLHGPARPGPGATPSHAAQVTAALDCPALTGMSRQDLAALAAALQTPFDAAREQHLYAHRGGPRRVPGWASTPYRGTLGPAARLLATVLTRRLSVPQ